MAPADALRDIKGYASANRISISPHAYQRMAQRGATYEDVRSALANATDCRAQADGRWKVDGPDQDGDELTVVVAIEDGVIVVTVF